MSNIYSALTRLQTQCWFSPLLQITSLLSQISSLYDGVNTHQIVSELNPVSWKPNELFFMDSSRLGNSSVLLCITRHTIKAFDLEVFLLVICLDVASVVTLQASMTSL